MSSIYPNVIIVVMVTITLQEVLQLTEQNMIGLIINSE